MAELFRVLKPGGWAILQTPVDHTRDTNYEDPAITDPDARERAFNQCDHVRIYGRDYKGRLERAGFTVKVDDYLDEFLYACNDNGIIEELESRGFSVADDKNVIVGGYPNREELSKMLGLRPWATNEQILEELNCVL